MSSVRPAQPQATIMLHETPEQQVCISYIEGHSAFIISKYRQFVTVGAISKISTCLALRMGFSHLVTPTSRASLSLYLGLRGLQIGSSAIAGFCLCYLIWEHNNHYCSFKGSNCDPWQQIETRVPRIYVALVTTVSPDPRYPQKLINSLIV
jgi:hypothetical protein